MKNGPRLTAQGLLLLRIFLLNPGQEFSGADLMKMTGMRSGTLYPILLRFERHGLLKSTWETEEPAVLKRPRKRLYTATSSGKVAARNSLRDLSVPAPVLVSRR